MDLSVVGLTRFLWRFGYLALPHDLASMSGTSAAPDGKLGEWDDSAREAMANYQKYHHLPITGVKDDDRTLALMCERRCGIIDSPYKRAATMAWPKRDLTWKLVNLSPDLPQNHISAAFNIGFRAWAAACNLKFTEVLQDQKSDIAITFQPIDTVGQVLAQAWFPTEGRMEVDENEKWSWTLPIARGEVDLATVAMHEIGHLIGLDHSNVRGAQMAPVYAGPKRFLEADDINRAVAIYGSTPS